jgi:LysR family transcriptional regulator of beta-lactamase
MFERDIAAESLVKLFDTEIDVGRYWLTRLRSRPESDAARIFREWLQSAA